MKYIFLILYVWAFGLYFSLIYQSDKDDVRGYRMVFWPIILIKWLIKSFIKALKD